MAENIKPNMINYFCAIEKCCLKCGEEKHRNDCPVGMAMVKINSTNELLTQFYRTK